MFVETLLESAGRHQRTYRGWTTITSFVLQIVVLSALAIGPMLYPEALSLVRRTSDIPIFSSAPQPVPPAQTQHSSGVPSAPAISVSTSGIHYDLAKPAPDTVDVGPPTGLSIQGTAPNFVIASDFVPPRPTTPALSKPLVISHMDPGSLVRAVKPIYPPIAVQTRTQGTVVLHALISKDGSIESLQLVSGHPLLARAALVAVRQWRYRPYILNGQPIEVDTQITVNFTLGND